MARPKFYFYCYPWDLEDEGLEESLGRLAGEIGVDGITVAATETNIRMIRGRPLGARRTFICPAGAHFQPDAAIHRDNRIRPIPAAWMKSKNPLERIAKVAEKERLKLRARVVLCENDELVERHPHAARVNVFGDSCEKHLCPAHPDVRQYASSVAEDLLKNYPIEVLELSQFGYTPAVSFHPSPAVDPMAFRSLMSVFKYCFCSACQQRATDSNIDTQAARQTVLRGLDSLFDSSALDRVDAKLEASPSLTLYIEAQQGTVNQFLQGICKNRKERTRVLLDSEPSISQLAPEPMESICGGVILPYREARQGHMFSNWEASLYETPPFIGDSQTTVKSTRDSIEQGSRAVIFDNYGAMPTRCLDWIRQAIRYAKRESAD